MADAPLTSDPLLPPNPPELPSPELPGPELPGPPVVRCRFGDPDPEPGVLAAITSGFAHLADRVPEVGDLRSRFAARASGVDRGLCLDAAAALLGAADDRWSQGRVIEALACEGLEARLLEIVVCGP